MAEKWTVSKLIYQNFHVTDRLHDVPNVKNFSHRFLIVNLFVSETMCRA
jgi:hypothetical protein